MFPGLGFHTRLIIAWVVLTAAPQLNASTLFEDDYPLEIELTGPMGTLVRTKEQRTEHPFTLGIDNHQLDILMRSRGKSRVRVCVFPPLKLNLEGADTRGTPLEGREKLKLVTRCNKSDRSEQDVLEEYAAYRIFQLLSDVSYRVRLVRITFNDTDHWVKQKYRESYGFLIAPFDALAARVGGEVSEIPAVSLKQLDDTQGRWFTCFSILSPIRTGRLWRRMLKKTAVITFTWSVSAKSCFQCRGILI